MFIISSILTVAHVYINDMFAMVSSEERDRAVVDLRKIVTINS